MENRNVAYDLSLFEDKQRQRQRKTKNNVVRMPKKKQKNIARRKKALSVFYISVISVFTVAVFSVMIYSQIQLTELTDKINAADKALVESQSTYTQLKMKAESKFSLRAVEQCAEKELFMSKIEPSQVEYVRSSNGDRAEMKEDTDKDNIFDKIKKLFG